MTMPPAAHRTAAALALWLLCGLLGLHGTPSGQPSSPSAGSPAGLAGVGGGAPDLLAARDPFRAVFGRPAGDARPAGLRGDGASAIVAAPHPCDPPVGQPLRHRAMVDHSAPDVPAHAFDARAPPRLMA
ncbi:hypothetical protein HL658_01355 [Azospirillum sp. RWY-5-1]|uniref:Uncharacterized protein n=1 Tax=Azospirillum oleiclasticum TaxID=2735135 RepID=A0ABX2T2Q3_9PROT|nr:hypothetical protein [Azospirillum oleiclasticum]NYZ11180.1 hypothetical protein [Azospirillum oleiclasticum]NYZ18342.1 hypothetical protein [Azospirillum oleiclasticum]